MSFEFRPAVRERIGLLFSLAGASGSGKTFSALLLAKGLANGSGRVAMIDTEAGRALHYADRFEFLHGDMAPPFTPERYVEAIHAAQEAGATVIVVDSMSHEWNGEGGCADIQAEIARQMATDRKTGRVDEWRIDAMSGPAWAKPKIRHKRMMSRLLQCRAHLIFCLRAEEKVKFVKEMVNGRERTNIVPIGWQPICEKNFPFEMSGSLTLSPETPGLARYDLPKKLSEELQRVFPDGDPVTEHSGAGLRAWAEKGKAERRAADRASEVTRAIIERVEDVDSPSDLETLTADAKLNEQREWLRQKRPELSQRVEDAISAKLHLHSQDDGTDYDDRALGETAEA